MDSTLIEEARDFAAHCRTLMLASVDPEGLPEASYAPFIRVEDGFAIYISDLALHTRNLLATRSAGVLFIEDEAQSAEIFARKRVRLVCEVTEIERGTQTWQTLMDKFEGRFPETIELVKPLTDFHLLVLKPKRGGYVRGFADAHNMNGQSLAAFLACGVSG